MNRNLAILISALFHPVFINLLSFVFVIRLNPYLEAGLSSEAKWFYVLYVFITTSLIPLFWVVMRKAMGFSRSIMLKEAHDRHVPYIVTATTYLFGYYLFLRINSPAPLQAFMLGSACVTTSVLIINFFTKISAHATSLGAVSGVLIALNRYTENDLRLLLVAILIISGIATAARLALDAHNRPQIYSGFALGMIVMWLIM